MNAPSDLLPGEVRVVCGVDPGTDTGLIVLAVERHGRTPKYTFLHRDTVCVPAITKAANPRAVNPVRSRVQAERLHAAALQSYMTIDAERATTVVIEEPWDISDGWGSGGRRRGTAFRVGAAYGRVLCAVPDTKDVVTYPVQGNQGTPGWMPRRTGRVVVYQGLGLAWRGLVKGGPKWTQLTEHEQSAFGVLHYHVRTKWCGGVKSGPLPMKGIKDGEG